MRTTFLSTSALLSLALLTACTTSPDGQQNSSSASSAQTSVSDSQVMIQISAPHANATVTSPLTVTGQARGNWYFEASFPVRLLDANGNEIAVTPAQAQSDWMTEDFVPFVATLTFNTPATPTGTLVLEKDNPSGLSENAAEVRIPVNF